eukprot:scaffold23054_cov31-Tisochrysis_lutea.AAC.2
MAPTPVGGSMHAIPATPSRLQSVISRFRVERRSVMSPLASRKAFCATAAVLSTVGPSARTTSPARSPAARASSPETSSTAAKASACRRPCSSLRAPSAAREGLRRSRARQPRDDAPQRTRPAANRRASRREALAGSHTSPLHLWTLQAPSEPRVPRALRVLCLALPRPRTSGAPRGRRARTSAV